MQRSLPLPNPHSLAKFCGAFSFPEKYAVTSCARNCRWIDPAKVKGDNLCLVALCSGLRADGLMKLF